MKIAIDGSRANRNKRTGVELYALHVIESLLGLGTDDKYLIYIQEKISDKFIKLTEKAIFKALAWPPRFLWTHIRLSYQLYIDKPDIFFVPAHVLPLYHPKKSIMTIHDVAFKKFPKAYSLKERIYQEWSIRFALKNCKAIIVPTQFTKDEILRFYPQACTEKINVVHHGFDSDEFTYRYQEPVRQNTFSLYNITKPYIFYVGRLETKKNIRNIIKAYNIFRKRGNDYQLVLAGKPGYGYNEVIKEREASEYKEDILVLDWVERCELPVLYQGAQFFIYTTIYEGFGFPILEAFASQTPVLTSKGGTFEEIGRNAAYYVDAKSIDEIALGMIELAHNNDLRKNYIKAGYARAQNFSWEKCAQEVHAIFSRM